MMIRLTTTSKDNGAWMKDMALLKEETIDKYTMIYYGHLIISTLYSRTIFIRPLLCLRDVKMLMYDFGVERLFFE